MKFGEWNVDPLNARYSSAPMLVIFFTSDNLSTEQHILELFFHETYRIASNVNGKFVYWARRSAPTTLPNIQDNVWLNPKCFERIIMHYDGYRGACSSIIELCCQEIYRTVLTPHSIFVELVDSDITLHDAAAAMALLAHTAKWVLGKRDASDREKFATVIALRDSNEARMCASLYSNYLMRFSDGKLYRIY